MQTRLYKEARLLWPAALLTLAAMLWPLATRHPAANESLVLMTLIVGCASVAACSFGSEFTSGTITLLLAQPLARTRIWRDKMSVLAVALGTISFSGLIAYYPHFAKPQMWLFVIAPIAAFCTVPFMTFVTRNAMGAVALSLAGPFLICLGGGALILWLFKSGAVAADPRGEVVNEEKLHRWLFCYFGLAVTVYTSVLYLLGYRWFRRLEVANVLDRQVNVANLLYRPLEIILARLFPLHSLSLLLRKELRLHQNAIVLLVILTVLQVATLLLVLRLPAEKALDQAMYFSFPLWLHALLMPLTIGAGAVAEEDKLGVLAWHFALPISLFSQWLLKVFVAAGLTILLGTGVLLGWSLFGSHLWSASPEFSHLIRPDTVGVVLALQLLGMIVAFYTSSLTRDTLRGFLTAAVLLFGIGLTLTSLEPFLLVVRRVGGGIIERIADQANFSWALDNSFGDYAFPILIVAVGFPILLSSFQSYRTVDRSLRRLWLGAVSAFLPGLLIFLIMVALSGAVYKVTQARRSSILKAERRGVQLYEGPKSRARPNHL